MAKYASFKRRGKKDTAPNAKTRRHNLRTGRDEKHFLPKNMRLPNYHLHPIPGGAVNEVVARQIKENEDRYQEKNNRRLRSDAVRIESALLILSEEQVANCNPDEIWQKCVEFKEWFEEEFNTKIRDMNWHRDEGKVDEKGELISRNNHIHIEYDNVDKEGQMVRRKFSKGALYKLQDKTAEIFKPLGFIRGEDSRKDPNYVVKRGLSIKEYRLKMKKEEDAKKLQNTKSQKKFNTAIIANSKDIKEKNKELLEEKKRIYAELKELSAEREDYSQIDGANRKMQQTIKELEQRAKDKELTHIELQKKFEDFKEDFKEIEIKLVESLGLNNYYKELLKELKNKEKEADRPTISEINAMVNTQKLIDFLVGNNYIEAGELGASARDTKLAIREDNGFNSIEPWELLKDALDLSDEESLDISMKCLHDSVKEKVTKSKKQSI